MPPTVILIRHAEALHNSTKDYTLPDPPLTPRGLTQCAALSDSLLTLPAFHRTSLIVTSPFRRTLQTTVHSLSALLSRSDAPVRVLAKADWQENSDKPCDTGSAVSEMAKEFPELAARGAFDEVGDGWPEKKGRHAFSQRAILERGSDCRRWLAGRPEEVVMAVSHSGFLRVGVSNTGFANADWRVFELEKGDDAKGEEEWRLVEWELSREKGGGMGRSEKGFFGVESQPWGEAKDEEAEANESEKKGKEVKAGDEAAREVPT